MKRNVKILITALVAVVLGLSLASTTVAFEADAAVVRESAVVDNFDAAALDDGWTADGGVTLQTVASCMRLRNMNIWQPAIWLQTYEIRRDRPCTVRFDLNVKRLTGWLGFVVGARSTALPFYDGDTMWMMSADSVGFWQKNGELAEVPAQRLSTSPLASATGENRVTVAFSFDYRETTSQGIYYDVTLAFGPKGGQPTTSKTYSHVQAESYIGFCSMANLAVDIENFSIYENDTEVLHDDFSSGGVVYPGNSDPSVNWRVTHTYGKDHVFVGNLKRVSFAQTAEGKLLRDYALQADSRLDKLFEMRFSLFADAFPDNTGFGVGFGLKNDSDYADSFNMAALKKDGRSLTLQRVVNGSVRETAATTVPLSTVPFGSADGVESVWTGYGDGTLAVTVAGVTMTLTDMTFDGKFAIAAAGAAPAPLSIDDFSLEVFKYRTADGADMAIDFRGTREFEQFGETYRERYYDRNIWYLSGSGVSLAPYSSTRTTNYLQLVNAAGKVAFGPKKQQYADFIVRFDVAMLTEAADTPQATAVGIAMGKRTVDTANENATCVMLSFNGSGTVVSGINATTAAGETQVPCAVNLWERRNTVYNVMMVVSDRTVSVYCKRADDDISELGVLRARFVDVNTCGYVAFTCNTLDGKTGNCTMTNFSIVNIAQ